MKIVYINGYKGENSSKPEKLQEIFKDDEIYHCKLKYNDKFNVNECIDYIKKIEPDILATITETIAIYGGDERWHYSGNF